MKTNSSIQVVLGLVLQPVSALIVRSNVIVNAMTEAGKVFPSSPIPFSNVTSDITALASAETDCKTRTAGLCVIRDEKKQIVVADMHQLHAYVQQLANATPAQAALIAQAAAMTLRKAPTVHKSDLAVVPVVSGTVKVVAKAVKGGLSHEWQFSTDGAKTWSAAPPTSKASTIIPGLQPGVLHAFRQRVITKNGPSDWSQPISVLVA